MAKRTLNNCTVILKMTQRWIRSDKKPVQKNGKCKGYHKSEYEYSPIDACKSCEYCMKEGTDIEEN